MEHPDFARLTRPDPAEAGPVAGWTEPDWIVLDKQPRFALVLDRSGSMEHGHKMAGAQYGAIYWLEYCAASEDLLTIIWYDHEIERIPSARRRGDLAGFRGSDGCHYRFGAPGHYQHP